MAKYAGEDDAKFESRELRSLRSSDHSFLADEDELERDGSASLHSDAKGIDGSNGSAAPSMRAAYQSVLRGGYNQTYLMMKSSQENIREVFFQCGQWCYKGDIDFFGVPLKPNTLPTVIPAIQRQQGKMKYFCPTKAVPENTLYFQPLQFSQDCLDFVATEITSEKVEKELYKWSKIYPWINEETSKTYFELIVNLREEISSCIDLIATKTYSRGLIIVSVLFENSFYFVVQEGEGDQPLLDVSFPNVSSHGQGLLLTSYSESCSPWKRLTLWHNMDARKEEAKSSSQHTSLASALKTQRTVMAPSQDAKPVTLSIASKNYTQTYVIKKVGPEERDFLSGHKLASLRRVLFRFGNWCYAGKIQLIPTLSLAGPHIPSLANFYGIQKVLSNLLYADVPFVIPALRMQQSKLAFLCDADKIPKDLDFAPVLQYHQSLLPFLEEEIVGSEVTLVSLIDRLTTMVRPSQYFLVNL